MKSYTINETQLHQDELTIEQDEKILELFAELEITDVQSLADVPLIKIISILTSRKIVSKFLSIILSDDAGNPADISVVKKIKNSQLTEIIEDFFILNPKVKELLKTLKTVVGSGMMNLTSSNTEVTSQD